MLLNMQTTYRRFIIESKYRPFNVKRTLRRFSIIIGFILLLLLLTAVTIITKCLLNVQTSNQAWVLHTQLVLSQVAQTQSLITNAETGQRAYITTGDPNYLGPYDLAVTQVGPNLQQLADLVKDSPQQIAEIANLRALIQTEMEMFSTNILLFQSGNLSTAREMVVSERGRLISVEVNKLMNELAQEQSSLKGTWAAIYQSSVGRTTASIYVAGMIVAIGLIFLAHYIVREINLRDRRARARLKREKLFRSTLTSLGDAVISTDTGGLVTFLNPKAELLMGIKLLRARGQPIGKVFPLFDKATLEPVESSVTKVIEHGHAIDVRSQALLKNSHGQLIPIKNNTTLIRDRRNELLGAVLVFREATYELQALESLQNTDRLAVSAPLLANASRQIDAPLIAANDLIYVAKLSEGITPETSDLLTLAERHLGRASHISREVLGFYREASAPEQFDLADIVDRVLRGFSSKLRSKNIAIQCDFQNSARVRGFPGELSQAIANLVSNAVDAVPYGGTIRAYLSSAADTRGNAIRLSIQDNGPAVPQMNRDRFFEPFFTTKEGTGYGLGLWTAKGIIEKHEGSIHVNFGAGDSSGGTIFNVILPIVASFEQPAMAASPTDQHLLDTLSSSLGFSPMSATKS